MQLEKLLSLFGMARKAGRGSLGFDQAEAAVRGGKARAVFCSADVSDRVKRSLERRCGDWNVPFVPLPTDMCALSGAVGQKTGVVAVNDGGFAARALQLSAGTQ